MTITRASTLMAAIHRNPRGPRAFTLVELLVVIALIAMLVTFTMPTIASVLASNDMNSAQQMVEQQLTLARQTAIARNRRVEVRFYKFDNPESSGSDKTFCALQLFLIEESNKATAVGRLTKLPATVLMNEAATNSSLLGLPDKSNWDATNDPKKNLSGGISDFTAKAFQFRPDGSTNLTPTNKWFVTMHATRAGASVTSGALKWPKNIATIQIDPVSGAVRSYRP